MIEDNIYIRYWKEGAEKQITKDVFYMNSLIANIICIISVIIIIYYFFRNYTYNKKLNKSKKIKIQIVNDI